MFLFASKIVTIIDIYVVSANLLFFTDQLIKGNYYVVAVVNAIEDIYKVNQEEDVFFDDIFKF